MRQKRKTLKKEAKNGRKCEQMVKTHFLRGGQNVEKNVFVLDKMYRRERGMAQAGQRMPFTLTVNEIYLFSCQEEVR